MDNPNVLNPVLKRNDVVLDPVSGRAKVGDGRRHWNDLPYTVGIAGPQGPPGETIIMPPVVGPAGPQGTPGSDAAAGITALTGDGAASGSGSVPFTLVNVPITASHDQSLAVVPLNRGGWTKYAVTVSDFTSTAGSLPNPVTGLVSAALINGAQYKFRCMLRGLNDADTNGFKICIGAGTGASGTAATIAAIMQFNSTSITSTASVPINGINNTGVSAVITYSAGEGLIFIRGFFTAASAGASVLTIHAIKVTSGTLTIRKGSELLVRLCDS